MKRFLSQLMHAGQHNMVLRKQKLNFHFHSIRKRQERNIGAKMSAKTSRLSKGQLLMRKRALAREKSIFLNVIMHMFFHSLV